VSVSAQAQLSSSPCPNATISTPPLSGSRLLQICGQQHSADRSERNVWRTAQRARAAQRTECEGAAAAAWAGGTLEVRVSWQHTPARERQTARRAPPACRRSTVARPSALCAVDPERGWSSEAQTQRSCRRSRRALHQPAGCGPCSSRARRGWEYSAESQSWHHFRSLPHAARAAPAAHVPPPALCSTRRAHLGRRVALQPRRPRRRCYRARLRWA
jgi:hypothetical protein